MFILEEAQRKESSIQIVESRAIDIKRRRIKQKRMIEQEMKCKRIGSKEMNELEVRKIKN